MIYLRIVLSVVLVLLSYNDVCAKYSDWPVGVTTVDEENAFGENLSGVVYQPGDVMWAVQNEPSKVFKLEYSNGLWLKQSSCGWKDGKTISYPDGKGAPDAEDIAKAEWESPTFYVCTERNNDDSDVSRMSVLMYNDTDCDDAATSLTAVREWDLTSMLPDVDENSGLEAVTWVPDKHLVLRSFYDEEHDKLYDPDDYPNHGTGLFFVGLEDNGKIYAFALDHNSDSAHRIADFSSGEDSIMALDFDRETCYLWAACDNTCDGRVNVLELPTSSEVDAGAESGVFRRLAGFERPGSMPNINNEGFTIGLENNCTDSFQKFAVWSDDSNTDDHALRQYLIPCGRFLS